MQRLIKFRAWDEEGYMLEVVAIDFEKGTLTGRINDTGGWSDKLSQFELMQFTGLLDKNGKEIYEGDIIRHSIWENEEWYTVKSEVSFTDGEFWLLAITLGHSLMPQTDLLSATFMRTRS